MMDYEFGLDEKNFVFSLYFLFSRGLSLVVFLAKFVLNVTNQFWHRLYKHIRPWDLMEVNSSASQKLALNFLVLFSFLVEKRRKHFLKMKYYFVHNGSNIKLNFMVKQHIISQIQYSYTIDFLTRKVQKSIKYSTQRKTVLKNHLLVHRTHMLTFF